jgi:4-hydroxybenzoate polyprenyltransferase
MDLLRTLRRALEEADRLARLHLLGFTGLLILLGITSADADPGWPRLAGVLAVGVAFHVFAYVFNDVVDLPVDRTHPDRRRDPLVRGALRPTAALALAMTQVPLALALSWWLRPDGSTAFLLAGAFAGMAVYDLWGKRFAVPPVTDAIQGLAWGCLALWAARTTGQPFSPLTWTAAGYGAAFILLINGVHGGLRDLATDHAQGRRTTALYLGARPGAAAPRGLVVFAVAGQLLLVAISLAPLVTGAAGYPPAARAGALAAVALLDAGCVARLPRVLRPTAPEWPRDFRVHLLLLLLPPIALFLPRLEAGVAVLLVAWFFLPLGLLEITRDLLRGMGRRAEPGGGGV